MAKAPKTTATKESVATFLDAIKDPQKRADAKALCKLMTSATGTKAVLWGTAIVGFGSYEAKSGPWPIVAFSPRSAAFALYGLGDFPGREALLAKLGKHKGSVGCLYVAKLADVDVATLQKMVEKAFKNAG